MTTPTDTALAAVGCAGLAAGATVVAAGALATGRGPVAALTLVFAASLTGTAALALALRATERVWSRPR